MGESQARQRLESSCVAGLQEAAKLKTPLRIVYLQTKIEGLLGGLHEVTITFCIHWIYDVGCPEAVPAGADIWKSTRGTINPF